MVEKMGENLFFSLVKIDLGGRERKEIGKKILNCSAFSQKILKHKRVFCLKLRMQSLEQEFKNIPSKLPVQKCLGGTPSKFLVQQIPFLYSRKHTYI